MAVPASIEKLLRKHNVSYSIADVSTSPEVTVMPSSTSNVHPITPQRQEQTAHAYLLQSNGGQKLLAIIPSQTILDLRTIKEAMGEAYIPIVGKNLESFTATLGLDSIAAMPKLGNLPTIVDKKLLDKPQLLLSVGLNNQLIQLDGESFEKLLESTTISDIATPLDVLNTATPTELDTQQITQSVEQFTELRVKRRLSETLELPPLPTTAQRIIKLRVDPNADISDLCEIIELDPSLAAQVISWASSPYYSAPGTIKSIHDAIVRVLGFDMVLSLSLGLALGSTLKLPEHCPEGCLPYWKQAVYVATCTEAIISCMPRESRPSYGCSYLSGLLHNFGYLIISEVFSGQFKTLCQGIDSNTHASPQSVEKHIIGVTRDQLAGWLMEYWHMPSEVCAAIRHQSDSQYEGDHSEYANLVYLTKKLLNTKGINTGVSDDPIPEELFTRFKLNRHDAEEAIDIMFESNDILDSMAQQMGG